MSQFWERWRHEVFIGLIFSGVVGLALVWMQVHIDDRRAEVDRGIEDCREDRAEMLADVAYIRETLRDDGPRYFYNLNLRGANLSGLDFGCALPGVADDSGQLLTPFDIEFGMAASTEVGFYSPVEYDKVDRLLESRKRHMNPEWPPEERVESPDSDCTRFSGSDFTGANLDETNFTGASLDDVVFAPEPVDESWFAGVTITGEIDAEIRRSDLRSVSFYADEGRPSHLEVQGSNLVGSTLYLESCPSITRTYVAGVRLAAEDCASDKGLARCVDAFVVSDCKGNRYLTGAGESYPGQWVFRQGADYMPWEVSGYASGATALAFDVYWNDTDRWCKTGHHVHVVCY